jgi:hypothetical protein
VKPRIPAKTWDTLAACAASGEGAEAGRLPLNTKTLLRHCLRPVVHAEGPALQLAKTAIGAGQHFQITNAGRKILAQQTKPKARSA